jgi:hypothetical protein
VCRDFSSCGNASIMQKKSQRTDRKQWPLKGSTGFAVVPEDLIGLKDVTCRKCRGQVVIISKAPEMHQFKVNILIAYDLSQHQLGFAGRVPRSPLARRGEGVSGVRWGYRYPMNAILAWRMLDVLLCSFWVELCRLWGVVPCSLEC